MRSIFQKWLLINIFVVFVLTFLLAFHFHTRQADKGAREMIMLKINDTIEDIEAYRQTIEQINEMTQSDVKTTLNAFAELITLDPTILTDQNRIDELTKTLDVEELVISDEKGILIAASPAELVGYDMSSNEQSNEFMPAIGNPDFLLVQPPMRRGIDKRPFQYVGRGRKDSPGIIQYGDSPEWFEKIEQVKSLENLANGFRIGTLGQIFVIRDNTIASIDSPRWVGKPLDEFGIPAHNFDGKSGEFQVNLEESRLIKSGSTAEKPSSKRIRALCLYKKTGDFIVAGILPADEMYISRNMMIWDVLLIYGLLFAVIFAVVSWLVDRIVIRGITEVNASLAKITEGDLNEKVNVRNNREFISLSDGINSTVLALKNAIAETAARIDKEIEFARAIQTAALPTLSPYPFEDQKAFSLFATMDTAKGVGGDFYDFLMVDDDHLAVEIADVSGKGIPASLFMMKSKAVLRREICSGTPADVVLERANALLTENNTSAMFVTTFLGILELSTGRFRATNAGHNAPVLLRRGQKPEYLDIKGGVILGAMDGIDYEKSELFLQPGDRIFLYTDGVTEALNKNGQLYGEERLLDALNSEEAAQLRPEPLLQYVHQQILQFTGGAPQSDDITMIALEYHGKQPI